MNEDIQAMRTDLQQRIAYQCGNNPWQRSEGELSKSRPRRARSLWRLVRCVRALGLSKGVRYWRIENLCIAEPAFALKLADALESEALLHEAGGVTKYVPCLRGFAADIRRHHAAFTANAKGQP